MIHTPTRDNPFPPELKPGMMFYAQDKQIIVKNSLVSFHHRTNTPVQIVLFVDGYDHPYGSKLKDYYEWSKTYRHQYEMRWLVPDELTLLEQAYFNLYQSVAPYKYAANSVWNLDVLPWVDISTFDCAPEFIPVMLTINKLWKRQDYYKTHVEKRT